MRQVRIFNSLSQKIEAFKPVSKNVGIYVCGITPYGVTHLGHAFTYTFFDVFVRYLRHLDYNVTYVQNVTDIDDDILRVAREQKKHWRELGDKHTGRFLQDMAWLHNEQPTYYVRATDHIADMQVIIVKLIQKKYAYVQNGSVYFDISQYKNYGKVSRVPKGKMLAVANERGNDARDVNKKHPLDFVLWQKVGAREPSWDSPWGQGRPGWHIECSAMSTKYLGQPFTIHGGGGDLQFPHHESEIAQSESAHGKPMAQYWMHTGMVRYAGEKMSKSLGNLVLIENLQKKYSGNIVRLALLLHHYREVWECTDKNFERAQQLNNTLQRVWLVQAGMGKQCSFAKERAVFFAALNDDMNTLKALAALEQLAIKIARENKQNITDAKAFLMQAFQILGLRIEYG